MAIQRFGLTEAWTEPGLQAGWLIEAGPEENLRTGAKYRLMQMVG